MGRRTTERPRHLPCRSTRRTAPMSPPRLFQANVGQEAPSVRFGANKGRVSAKATTTGVRLMFAAARQEHSAAPAPATDVQVSPYADNAYQYNPSSKAVIQAVVQGAGGAATGG